MKKKYSYKKSNSLLKGLSALSGFAFFVAFIVFGTLTAINYISAINHLIDLSELEYAVNSIYMRLDAFLLLGIAISLISFIISCTMVSSVKREKGGFKAFVLLILSVALIVFYAILKGSKASFGYILNYSLGGILLIGIIGALFGLYSFLYRLRVRSKLAKNARRFERNYLKYEKYNK